MAIIDKHCWKKLQYRRFFFFLFLILPVTIFITSHDTFAACGQLQTKVYAKTTDRYPVGGAPQGFAIILDKNGNPKYYAASNGAHSVAPIPVSIFTYSTKPKLIKNSSFRIKGMNQLGYYSPSNLLFIHGYSKPMFSLDSLSLKNKSYSFYTDKFAYMDGGYIILAGAGNFTIYKDFIKSGSTPARSKVAGPYQTKNAGGHSYNNGAFYSNGVFYQIGSGHGTGNELGAFDVDTGKKIGCWTASYNLDDGDAVNNKGYLTVMPDPNGTSYLEVREITGPANLLKLLKRNYNGKYAKEDFSAANKKIEQCTKNVKNKTDAYKGNDKSYLRKLTNSSSRYASCIKEAQKMTSCQNNRTKCNDAVKRSRDTTKKYIEKAISKIDQKSNDDSKTQPKPENGDDSSKKKDNSVKDVCSSGLSDDPLICPKTNKPEEKLQHTIRDAINVVFLWVGIIAVVVVVISGISLMLAQGNPEKITKAKHGIMYSIIGLLITLAAFAIVTFIIDAIG